MSYNALSALRPFPFLILVDLKLNYPAVDWERFEMMEMDGQRGVGPASMNSSVHHRILAIAAWQVLDLLFM